MTGFPCAPIILRNNRLEMPTYDYVCSGCGHRFERFEGIRDGRPKECPKCHKKKAKRMMSAGAGVIFKGSGFYTTDYKRPASDPAGGEPEKKKAEPEKKKTERKEKKEDKEPKK